MGDVSPRTYYQRQMRVPGWGESGQQVLGRATVLVVGVGGLGCPALASLVRSGVGRLVFCDPDRVEASNLPRQGLFSLDDVGKPKVEAAARALGAANPWVDLGPKAVSVDATNVRPLVESADLVIEGTDNFATKFLVHDACRSAGVPLVAGSLHQWEALVTAFDFSKTGPGCWRCLYPEAPLDGCVGVCADTGVAGALSGVAGNALALVAIRVLLGVGTSEHCSTVVFDGTDLSTRRLRWRPSPSCGCQKGPGDWSWLVAPGPGPRIEARWDDLPPGDRTVVVDLREPREIADGDWEFFERNGSRVVAARWSRWATEAPHWDPTEAYLLVCAHGVRSRVALASVPPGIRAASLAGGIAGLFS